MSIMFHTHLTGSANVHFENLEHVGYDGYRLLFGLDLAGWIG